MPVGDGAGVGVGVAAGDGLAPGRGLAPGEGEGPDGLSRLLTPPFGLLVYTVKAATQDEDPDVSMVDIFKSSTPYWVIILLCMLLIIWFPGVATVLPDLMF